VLTLADVEAYIAFVTERGSDFQSQEALNLALTALLGENVFKAINAYYRPFYERALGNTHFNALLINEIAPKVTFSIDPDYHSAILNTLGDIFARRSFPVLLSELE
jgi:hypothetical protein